MNPLEREHHLLDGIALTALHLKFDVIIYVAPGNLSLLQCVQVCIPSPSLSLLSSLSLSLFCLPIINIYSKLQSCTLVITKERK